MSQEKKIVVIVNPIAGDLDKEAILDQICSISNELDWTLDKYITTGKDDRKHIKHLIEHTSPERVLVVGGDGTISMVSEFVINKDISLGIVPAGSANGLAANLMLPPTLREQIETALSNNVFEIDVIYIDGQPCLHISDLGLNAELIKNYEESGIRGKLGYFLQTLPTLFNSQYPFDYIIETKEETYEQTGILLAVANANRFGTGATINPGGEMNDGLFEILVFKNLDIIEMLKTAQVNPKMSPDFVWSISTSKAVISTTQEVPFQIDGEFMGEVRKISVSIEKRCLKLVVPAAFK